MTLIIYSKLKFRKMKNLSLQEIKSIDGGADVIGPGGCFPNPLPCPFPLPFPFPFPGPCFPIPDML